MSFSSGSSSQATRPTPAESSGTSPPSPSTTALHGSSIAGGPRRSGPLVGALVQSTTFRQPHVGATGHAYSRVSNPSVDEIEDVLGALENAPPAVCFGTGLAAETALFLALLRAGDHAVIGECVYGGTVRLFRQVLSELGITSTFVDSTDLAACEAAINPRTKLVFVESPANPTLKLTDIRAIAAICKQAHGGAGVKLAVDNTFLTPVLQRPLDLGADISVYSTTKIIEGHSTACGGSIGSRDAELLARVRWIRKCTGGIQAPFNAWLTARGVKTLPLRLRQQSRNALIIAQWLEQHPQVARVNYPGLASFPQLELAKAQHVDFGDDSQFGSVLSFEVVGGIDVGRRVLESARLCALVEHIGGVETLLTHPATMTHADVPPDQRRRAGIADGLIRLSVGLEEPGDVIADLQQAIEISQAHSEVALVAKAARSTSSVTVVGGAK